MYLRQESIFFCYQKKKETMGFLWKKTIEDKISISTVLNSMLNFFYVQ